LEKGFLSQVLWRKMDYEQCRRGSVLAHQPQSIVGDAQVDKLDLNREQIIAAGDQQAVVFRWHTGLTNAPFLSRQGDA
jgi:hypothetical protein